jgi:hypothetical protein
MQLYFCTFMETNLMKAHILLILAGLLLFSSCKKISTPNNNNTNSGGTPSSDCALIEAAVISTSKTTYNPGESIILRISPTDPAPNADQYTYISWYKQNGIGELSEDPTAEVDNCGKGDEGWYYLALTNGECNTTYLDSVYITVVNAPATAPCSLTNNTVAFSSLPDISFSSTTYTLDGTWNSKLLYGEQAYGYPDISVYFNQYWNTHEPEDGEYSLTDIADLGDETNVYTVYISSLYSGINFQSESGNVYVSHSGGKLVVQFCSLQMVGYNGSSYTTTASGMLTAP